VETTVSQRRQLEYDALLIDTHLELKVPTEDEHQSISQDKTSVAEHWTH